MSWLSDFLKKWRPPPVSPFEATIPSKGQIRAITAQCSTVVVQSPQIPYVGLSDPNAGGQGVINLVTETGCEWVRAEFHWSIIEPTPGAGYNWSAYDNMVAGYNAAGVKVLAILTYIPKSQPPDWGVIDANFQAFAEACVQRYAPLGVHHWEVFNEPNLTGYGWLSKELEAEKYLDAYVLLLARANQAVRANDPEGVVVLGGIASEQHRGMPMEATMDRIYDLGGGNCFDVMAFHPYGYQGRMFEARARVDAVLTQYGDTGKPVWFNEYGWTDYEAMDINVNQGSANPMIRVFQQIGSCNALFWFAAKDYSAQPGTPTFGLADYQLEKRPSFETFKALVGILRA